MPQIRLSIPTLTSSSTLGLPDIIPRAIMRRLLILSLSTGIKLMVLVTSSSPSPMTLDDTVLVLSCGSSVVL